MILQQPQRTVTTNLNQEDSLLVNRLNGSTVFKEDEVPIKLPELK